MRDVLASKLALGVAVSAATLACGGCQSGRVVAGGVPPVGATGSAAAPESVASAKSTAMAAPAPAGDSPASVSQSDVIGWAARGVTDDVIVDRIDHAQSTFHLSAGDEMRLRDAGVSDDVIRAMKATVWN